MVVCPWRALNPTQREGGSGADQGRACGVSTSSKQLGGEQLEGPLTVSPVQTLAGGRICSISGGEALASAAPKCRVVSGGRSTAPPKTGGLHPPRSEMAKARLFHVDSMGLRSVFDRCRGRLKRFLRRVRGAVVIRCGSILLQR